MSKLLVVVGDLSCIYGVNSIWIMDTTFLKGFKFIQVQESMKELSLFFKSLSTTVYCIIEDLVFFFKKSFWLDQVKENHGKYSLGRWEFSGLLIAVFPQFFPEFVDLCVCMCVCVSERERERERERIKYCRGI